MLSKSKYPASGKHIEDAWAGKPSQFRPSPPEVTKAHLLTIDRPNTDMRRKQSIAGTPVCKQFHENKQGELVRDQRDEYPPAAFIENAGKGHLRCIPATDNEGSGKSFDNQLRQYRARKDVPTVKLADGDVVEFVVTLP